MAGPIWPLPPGFPAQQSSDPAYHVVACITYQGRILTLHQDNLRLERQGTLFSPLHFSPDYGSGWFQFPASTLPSGLCRLWVRLPSFENVQSFTFYADPLTGAAVADAAWPGSPVRAMPGAIVVKVEIPNDVKCRLLLSLGCSDDGVASVTDGRAWAGNVPLAAGPGPGVPPAQTRFFRGTLAPGTPLFRFEHPRYTVPQFPVAFAANANVLLTHVNLNLKPAPDPPPVPNPFVIVGANGFMQVNEVREFSTNLPSHGWMVEWSWTPHDLFSPVQFAHKLRATRGGVGTVTARYKTATASVNVVVRGGAADDVFKPIDFSNIVVDPWVGGRVIRGELLCEMQEGVDDAAARAVFARLNLTPVGARAGGRYQLAFDPAASTLEAMIGRLSADPLVAQCCPHAIGSYAESPAASMGIPAYVPQEEGGGQPAGRTWYFGKIEAYEAFGIMRTLKRVPQTVAFVDEGIWVSSAGQAHKDFHARVQLKRSLDFSGWSVKTPTSVSDLHHPGDGWRPPHGTMVISAATAAWDNGLATGLGLDPAIQIALLKCDASLNQQDSALLKVAEWIGPDFKVVTVTFNAWFLRLVDPFNRYFKKAFKKLIKQGALIVVAAGNYDIDAAHVVVASIKAVLSRDERRSVVVVGGTQPSLGPPLDPHGPETRWVSGKEKGGSDYDTNGSAGHIDLAAPASYIKLSGTEDGQHAEDGTSYSAPMVSAAAALILSILPDATAPEVKQMLVETSDHFRYAEPDADRKPRLWVPGNRSIGTGRLNLWQALLAALNTKAVQYGLSPRYVGLRTTSDMEGLELSLDYGNDVIVKIPQRSIWNQPSLTTALRFTFTNADGASFPRAIIARAAGGTIVAFRRPLPWRAKEIDALKPKYVMSVRMFTGGQVGLTLDPPPAGNRIRLRVSNRGRRPIDEELLDPMAWTPGDPSLKPWMRLAAGDTFALKAVVVPFPAGTQVKIERESGAAIPEVEVHDELRPCVTIPFPAAGPPWAWEDLRVTVTFPADAVPPQATLTVNAISLNNYAVEATEHLRFVPQQPELGIKKQTGFLFGPDNWWRVAQYEIRNLSSKTISGLLAYNSEPLDWGYGAGHGLHLDPGESASYAAKFTTHDPTAPGTANQLIVASGSVGPLAPGVSYRFFFDSVVGEPPDVAFQPAALRAAGVRVDPWNPDTAFAEWPVTLVNRSAYPVVMFTDYWLVTSQPADLPPARIELLDAVDAKWELPPGQQISLRLRIKYPRSMIQPPGSARTVRHVMTVLLADPHREWLGPEIPPHADNKDYRAAPLAIEVVLTMLPGVPPSLQEPPPSLQ